MNDTVECFLYISTQTNFYQPVHQRSTLTSSVENELEALQSTLIPSQHVVLLDLDNVQILKID